MENQQIWYQVDSNSPEESGKKIQSYGPTFSILHKENMNPFLDSTVLSHTIPTDKTLFDVLCC